MKKLELMVSKQNNVETIKYALGAADVYDDRVADKITQYSNIIPFQYKDEDGKRSITSYVHEDTNLEVMLKRVLTKKEVLSIMSGLAATFEIGAQGIPVSYLVKDLKHIYVNRDTFAIKCIMVPVKQDVMPLAEIPALFRAIISKMKFNDEDKDNYVAKLLTLINSDDFSNNKFKTFVDEQLNDMGMFISKDNGLVDLPDDGVQNVTVSGVKVNKIGVMNNMQNSMRSSMMPQGQPQPGGPRPMMPQGQPQPGMPGAPQPGGPRPMMPQGQPQPGMPGVAQPGGPRPMMPQGQPQPGMPGAPQPGGPRPMMSQGQPQPGMPGVAQPGGPRPMMPQGQPQPGMPGVAQPMMPQPMAPQNVDVSKSVQPQPVAPQNVETPKSVQPQPLAPQNVEAPKSVQPQPVAPQNVEVPKPVQPQPLAPQNMEESKSVEAQSDITQSAQTSKLTQPEPIKESEAALENLVENEVNEDNTATDAREENIESKDNKAPEIVRGSFEITHGSLVGQLGTKPIPHIVRKKTGEIINITKPEFAIGKSKSKADYAIENNSAISRVHCIIVQRDGVNYIKDNNSTNHTYINGVELQPGKEMLLKNKMVIQLGDEEFTFLLRKGE